MIKREKTCFVLSECIACALLFEEKSRNIRNFCGTVIDRYWILLYYIHEVHVLIIKNTKMEVILLLEN